MKKTLKTFLLFFAILSIFTSLSSCKKEKHSKETVKPLEAKAVANQVSNGKKLTQQFKNYWYAGEAEISSYKLDQARYGEMRTGHAVLIYVTEDFLPTVQVKADNKNADNIPVLKLNATKNFNTGIYPYSIMQSTFYPVSNTAHAMKVSSSIQEWCGHAYTQLNNKNQFEIMSHSYFEGEADENFKLEKTILENELWTQLRIDPESLPIGDLQIVPSFEFTRLRHVPLKAYKATAALSKGSYSIFYPELNRTLIINFNANFPHDILSWEETFKSGFGENAKQLTTRATKLKTIKSAYWTKNRIIDETLRDSLQLH
ncbi:septum formation inhibitor Maf [Mariniflexile sp.]|uniref:septum formation inhibitor Maf n=1 Tax=Mariniflexile sp. TaxID=1979402 RepID=UPI00404821F2